MDHLEDDPPFALVDEQKSPLHIFQHSIQASPSPRPVSKPTDAQELSNSTQLSSSSSPPGLVESVMTDGSSSVPSYCDSDIIGSSSQPQLDSSSTFMLSSLQTVTSDAGESLNLSSSHLSGVRNIPNRNRHPHSGSTDSVGFSQLMLAADDTNLTTEPSRMPIVPEHEALDTSEQPMESGTLISPPGSALESASLNNTEPANTWFPSFLVPTRETPSSNPLEAPLLASSSGLHMPLLCQSPPQSSLERTKASVHSFLEDDQSFEVSMLMEAPCNVEDVMAVISNPELLKMWCDPIQTLVVTSSSDVCRGGSTSSSPSQPLQERQYDAEWVEATTTALESPPSSVGYLYSAGQSLLQTLGFASYGRITMFVERSRGQVSLTVGPFSGGVHAAHSIRVFEDGGRVRVVDRVRLNHEPEQESIASMFFCNVFDSCLSACICPALTGYMDQVTTSMARLRLLVETDDIPRGQLVVSPP